MERLRSRVRNWTLFFIIGLVLSGVTALPIPTEVAAGSSILGNDMSAGGKLPEFVAGWLRTLRDGIHATAERAPFMFYGTDWLAFGHLMIALAFVGALRDPVRNRWLYQRRTWRGASRGKKPSSQGRLPERTSSPRFESQSGSGQMPRWSR